ncbi:MAG: PilT/PilU family type 4a pilus ATPase [Gammaproteobacteria bacterium]
MNLEPYLRLMAEQKASDLYLTTGSPIKIRVQGRILSVGKIVLDVSMIREAALGIMPEAMIDQFEEKHQTEFAMDLNELGRYRVNAFLERSRVAMAIRFIPKNIPELSTLALPPLLTELTELRRGLILVVGATGAGKSTTLAAMIDHRNAHHTDHILTIEDPIEYVYINRQSIVNQREIGNDVLGYADALRSALRATPDVILIGEIRDQETMTAAIEMAGTGHLTLATLHTSNAHQTLERILNLYPEYARRQILTDLAVNLRAIIAQRLVPNLQAKLVAAVEILLNTPHMADLIRKGDLDGIREGMEQSVESGMQTFDTALHRLYREGVIDLQTALGFADSRTNLESKIRFG